MNDFNSELRFVKMMTVMVFVRLAMQSLELAMIFVGLAKQSLEFAAIFVRLAKQSQEFADEHMAHRGVG